MTSWIRSTAPRQTGWKCWPRDDMDMWLTMRKIFVLNILYCHTAVSNIKTIQSQIDYDNAKRLPTTTSAPWPKLTIDEFDGSPEDPWRFAPHRPTSIRPRTAAHTFAKSEIPSKEILTPTFQNVSSTKDFKRYILPIQKSDKISSKSSDKRKVSSFKQKLRQIHTLSRQLSPKNSVIVSIPKIYVDMALTGHYSKISVPKRRIRYV